MACFHIFATRFDRFILLRSTSEHGGRDVGLRHLIWVNGTCDAVLGVQDCSKISQRALLTLLIFDLPYIVHTNDSRDNTISSVTIEFSPS